MSVDTCRSTFAEDIEVGDLLDFSMDELCYNDYAECNYAEVKNKTDWWDAASGEPWCTLYTDQGVFEVPADHKVMLKVE